jgi:hypothetical protein
LLFPRGADRAARRIDAIGDRRFLYGAAIPYGLQTLVLGDDAFRVRVLREIGQQVEDLRLDHDRLGAALQLPTRDVEDKIVEPQPYAISTTRQGTNSGLARFMAE